jgi:CBS domain-containing protein
MRVDELMSREVISVTPDTTLKDVAACLAAHRIAGVPVCDDAGRVLGIVSEADILWKELGQSTNGGGVIDRVLDGAFSLNARISALTAAEAMTSPAITVAPGTTVTTAARLMVEQGINRLPVVEEGRLVGIIARADLVRAFQRSDDQIEREITQDVLLGALWVDPAQVQIDVSDGAVTLSGAVENRSTAELIEAYVRRVPGVTGVSSELTWKLDDLARRTKAGANRLPRKV